MPPPGGPLGLALLSPGPSSQLAFSLAQDSAPVIGQGLFGDGGMAHPGMTEVLVPHGGLSQITTLTLDMLGQICAVGAPVPAPVTCWGSNARGECGASTPTPALTPINVAVPPAYEICAGVEFSCARAGSPAAVYCWGNNDARQLGHSPSGGPPDPAKAENIPATVTEFAAGLACGWDFACAWTNLGNLWCWGANDLSQLGLGKRSLSEPPTLVMPGVKSASCGDSHSCAVTMSGQIACFGSGARGQLGNGRSADRAAPTKPVVGLP